MCGLRKSTGHCLSSGARCSFFRMLFCFDLKRIRLPKFRSTKKIRLPKVKR